MSYGDLSLRRKQVWTFHGDDCDLDAVRDVGVRAVETGSATETMFDRREDGPERYNSRRGDRTVALLHLYDVLPEAQETLEQSCREAGGRKYEVLERAVFDRRSEADELTSSGGWSLIGTQTRQDHLDRREFVRRWGAGHAELVRQHHPGVARYTQNYVSSADEGVAGFDGFFESYFPTFEAWSERLYDSPEGRELLASDANSFLNGDVTEWIWVSHERFGPDWSDFEAR